MPAQPAGTKELAWPILLPPSAPRATFSGRFGSVPLPFPDGFDDPVPVPVVGLDPFVDLVYRILYHGLLFSGILATNGSASCGDRCPLLEWSRVV